MNLLSILAIIVVIWIAIYSIVDRIFDYFEVKNIGNLVEKMVVSGWTKDGIWDFLEKYSSK